MSSTTHQSPSPKLPLTAIAAARAVLCPSWARQSSLAGHCCACLHPSCFRAELLEALPAHARRCAGLVSRSLAAPHGSAGAPRRHRAHTQPGGQQDTCSVSQLAWRRSLPSETNYTDCRLKNNTSPFPLQNGLWQRRIAVSLPRQNNEAIATKEWNTFFYDLDNSVSFFKDLIKQPVKL